MTQIDYLAKAFISCSLRSEDREFIQGIEWILKQHRILPFGTVGLYSASPTNPTELMREKISEADLVVIVATPRYIQKDVGNNNTSTAISEMLQVEAGIAYAMNKPVVVFVKEGTSVGNFLPNITQYIILKGNHVDLKNKWSLINSILNNAYNIIINRRQQRESKGVRNLLVGSLAVYGLIKAFDK